MERKRIIVINKNSGRSQKVVDYFKKNNISYLFHSDLKESKSELRNYFAKDYTDFILCGGDGTINKFLNEYANLPKFRRERIRLGIIPCGRANDLARALGIPLSIEESFKLTENGHLKEIDFVKVNDSYFITGGGLGIPAEIINDIAKYPKVKKKLLGESVYLWATLKKFLFGYEGINLNGRRLLAIYVLNQSFIGKKFKIAPEAKNDDGLLNIKYVGIPSSFISKVKTLSWGGKGKIDKLSWVKDYKGDLIKISLKNKKEFMGDGEILEKAKDFSIKILPGDLKIFVN